MQIQYTNQPPPRFAESIRQSIDSEVSKAKNTVEKGRLFLRWVLTKVFHATEDDAENGRLDGPNDQGMDAILEFEGTEMNFFRIFQSKYGTSHSVDAIRAFQSKVSDLLAQKPNELPLGRIRDALIHIKKKDWECEAIYVTDQKVDFKSSDDFHVLGFDQIVEMLWNEITEPAAGKVETISLVGGYAKHDNTIIGTISLSELGNLVLRSRKYIFESNIRKFLSAKTKVNKQLRESLLKEPEEVFYYNNGITIVVKNFEEMADNKIKLSEPQIVNGAQTSSTIADVVRGDPNIQGKIQITIIQETIRTTRNNITKYRNSQNAVKGKDLISLELFHRSISGQLKNKLRYFYEQQAGSWMALPDKERQSHTLLAITWY
ncbi:MAG: AIPR family protein [Candidatus Nitrosotenuis sp.]